MNLGSAAHQHSTLNWPLLRQGPANPYYEGESWLQQLGLLEYLCQYSEQVIVLTGPKGVGKSTLKQAFLDKTEQQFKLCNMVADKSWDVATSMRRLAQGFGLAWEDTPQVQGTRYHNRPAESPLWVVLIDDAHFLATRILHALLQLAHPGAGGGGQLRFIFIGDETLEQKFSDPHLRSVLKQPIQTLELTNFSAADSEAYALFKGFHEDEHPQLDHKQLYQMSRGNPDKINNLILGRSMEEIAEGQAPEGQGPKKTNPVQKIKALFKSVPPFYWTAIGSTVGASLITTSLLGFFLSPKPQASPALSVQTLAPVVEASHVAEATNSTVPDKEVKAKPEKNDTPVATVDPKAQTETRSQVPAPVILMEKSPSPSVAASATSESKVAIEPPAKTPGTPETTSAIAMPAAAPATAVTPVASAVPHVTPTAATTTPAVAATPTTAVGAVSTTPAAVTNQAAVKSPVASPSKTPAAVARKPQEPMVVAPGPLMELEVPASQIKKAALSAKATTKATAKTFSASDQELLKVGAEHYALQLMGSHSEATVKNFLQSLDNPPQARYYRSTYKGQAWYVVVYGNYPNREAALKGINQLPAKLQNSQPWVLRYAEIQRALQSRSA